MRIQTVQESSKSELSSVTFGRFKVYKKRSVSQMIDLVVTINSVQESSKSELSSVTFGHVKVYSLAAGQLLLPARQLLRRRFDLGVIPGAYGETGAAGQLLPAGQLLRLQVILV